MNERTGGTAVPLRGAGGGVAPLGAPRNMHVQAEKVLNVS